VQAHMRSPWGNRQARPRRGVGRLEGGAGSATRGAPTAFNTIVVAGAVIEDVSPRACAHPGGARPLADCDHPRVPRSTLRTHRCCA